MADAVEQPLVEDRGGLARSQVMARVHPVQTLGQAEALGYLLDPDRVVARDVAADAAGGLVEQRVDPVDEGVAVTAGGGEGVQVEAVRPTGVLGEEPLREGGLVDGSDLEGGPDLRVPQPHQLVQREAGPGEERFAVRVGDEGVHQIEAECGHHGRQCAAPRGWAPHR